jgi:hypothetical protein
MKYFLLLIILTSCSLNNNSTYLNESKKNKTENENKISEFSKKDKDFRSMTFNEFDIFLKVYSNKSGYPDINN